MNIVSISILEAIYLIYVYNFFKTKYSIHHPMEYTITGNSDILKHPISTGIYENKVCKLGSYASILGAILLIYRGIVKPTPTKYTQYIVILWLVVAGLMNMNAFIYILPLACVEYYLHNRTRK